MKYYNFLFPILFIMSCQGNSIDKIKGISKSNVKQTSIGRQLKQARHQNDMSIQDFAKAFNLLEYNVKSLESDRAKPSRELLLRIQDSLRVIFIEIN